MGIIWYFEVISFYDGGEWSTAMDVINMLQVWIQKPQCLVVGGKTNIMIFTFTIYCAGSLGLPHLCLQEKCLECDPEEERQTLQCRPSEVAV